jgi:hypothetical protein
MPGLFQGDRAGRPKNLLTNLFHPFKNIFSITLELWASTLKHL